jgi:hypothetical protein
VPLCARMGLKKKRSKETYSAAKRHLFVHPTSLGSHLLQISDLILLSLGCKTTPCHGMSQRDKHQMAREKHPSHDWREGERFLALPLNGTTHHVQYQPHGQQHQSTNMLGILPLSFQHQQVAICVETICDDNPTIDRYIPIRGKKKKEKKESKRK